VRLERAQAEVGDIIPVRIAAVSGYDLRAELLTGKRKESRQEIDLAQLPL
jgi:hypothetical protein